MAKESGVPNLFTELKAREVTFAVGDVSIDEIKVRKLDSLDATFGERVAVLVVGPRIAFLDFRNKSVENIERLDFGKNGGAGITRALGAVPNFEIVGEVDFGLALFGFGFLKADDVGLFGVYKIEESSLFQAGAEAVDVPGIDFDMLFSIVHVRDPAF